MTPRLHPFRLAGAILGLALAAASAPAREGAPQTELVAEVDGRSYFTSGMGFLATPGQRLPIRVTVASSDEAAEAVRAGQAATVAVAEQYQWSVESGELLNLRGREVVFHCPLQPGTTRIRLRYIRATTIDTRERRGGAQATEGHWTLNVFVQFPFDRNGNGSIDGYPVGIYPDETSERAPSVVTAHADAYQPPRWFARVASGERDIYLSPHFKIGDFCSPYTDESPTFVAIDPELLERLERLRSLLAISGKPPAIRILRAYLSPNHLMQLRRRGLNLTRFTRHMYGDAASLIVDSNGDLRMDDLNGDGAADLRDIDIVSRLVEQIEREQRRPGGLGVHAGPTDPLLPDTPYLSFDCRGWRARWSSTGSKEE